VDLDVFVALPRVSGSLLVTLRQYLTARGGRVEGERIVVGQWPVQFLPPHGALEEEALEEAVKTEVDGIPVWVLRAEHLVAIALKTGRAKDYARIVQFLEQDALDAHSLHRILEKHGLTSEWEKFKSKYVE
jgi:hypothetical protein